MRAQCDSPQADLVRSRSSPQAEVGRGLPGFTPSSVRDMSYQTSYTDPPARSGMLNTGESSHVGSSSAGSDGTVVQFLQDQQDLSFLGKEAIFEESSSSGFGSAAVKMSGGVVPWVHPNQV